MWNLILATLVATAPTDNSASRCVGEQAGYPRCSFAVVVEPVPGTGTVILRSQQSANKDGLHTKWKDLASITLTRDRAHRAVEILACEYKGREDDTVVALVSKAGSPNSEMIGAVDWAYRIDLPSGRFVAIDPHYVRCRQLQGNIEA